MEHTANYDLTQWAMADRIQMQDFNADNQKLDAALTEHAEQLKKLPQLGNCQIYTATYTGNGQCGEGNPSTLTFPKKPLLVMITENGYTVLHLFPFNTSYSYSSYPTIYVKVNWNGRTVTWSATTAEGQMNYTGRTYYVTAFYPMD